MITICFDFGNTRLKYAVFDGDVMTHIQVLEKGSLEEVAAALEQHRPHRSILSSVISHDPLLETFLAEKTSFHKLSHESKLPFTVPVGKPETMGADRIALAAAMVKFYPGKNNLVVGLGTAITYNFINKYNEFWAEGSRRAWSYG